jgi:hypothetical protein
MLEQGLTGSGETGLVGVAVRPAHRGSSCPCHAATSWSGTPRLRIVVTEVCRAACRVTDSIPAA